MRDAGTDPWVENLFRPLVMGIMVGCIAWSVVELIRSFAPAWNGTFLVVGCVLVAWEANYSYRLLKTRWQLRFNTAQFRVAELVVILSALKVGSYIGDGWSNVLADIQNWPRNPFTMFDPETLVAFVLALLSWTAVNQTLDDLERLGQLPGAQRSYVPPIESLSQRFWGGGVILLIAAGFTRVAPTEIPSLERPSVPGLVLNALIYFLLGLVMLGQVQHTRLRIRWQAQKVKVAGNLAARWARYSLTFIGLAALAAFLLPTGYTSGLLGIVALALVLFTCLAGTIAWLLIAIIALPLIWLLQQLAGSPEPVPQEAQPPPLIPSPTPAESGGAGPDWFVILRALLFWAFILGVLFYVLRRYLRDRPGLWEALVTLRPIQALRRGWVVALWQWLKKWSARLSQTVSERLPRQLLRRSRRDTPIARPLRFFRLGALPPREQVIHYYLNILRQARKEGLGRGRHQTPYEYQVTLESDLAQTRQEIEGLTQAFVEARYSQHELEAQVVPRVRAYWARIKRALRRRKQERRAGE